MNSLQGLSSVKPCCRIVTWGALVGGSTLNAVGARKALGSRDNQRDPTVGQLGRGAPSAGESFLAPHTWLGSTFNQRGGACENKAVDGPRRKEDPRMGKLSSRPLGAGAFYRRPFSRIRGGQG
jgi:hypothetical protein